MKCHLDGCGRAIGVMAAKSSSVSYDGHYFCSEVCAREWQRPAVPGKGPEEVAHPKHYNEHASGVECIIVAQWFSFNLGCAIKYIWRHGGKKGHTLEDLRKAAFYLDAEIKRIEQHGGTGHVVASD